MSKGNQFSGAYTNDQHEAVGNSLKKIRDEMPFLITLTKKEKKALKPMAARSLPMVEKAFDIGNTDPKLVPSFTDINEMGKDLAFWKAIRPHALEIISLASQIDDTMAAAGSDANRAALDIYNHLKKAADRNVPNAKAMYEEMKPYFEKATAKEPVPPKAE